MLKEFKAFALRGNVVDLAIGVIIGVAFGALVNSLVNDVILNLVAALVGEPDFSDLTFTIGRGVIRYGAFLTALLNFLIVALVLFFIVKAMNRLKGTPPETPKMRECPYCRTSLPAAASRCSGCTSELQSA